MREKDLPKLQFIQAHCTWTRTEPHVAFSGLLVFPGDIIKHSLTYDSDILHYIPEKYHQSWYDLAEHHYNSKKNRVNGECIYLEFKNPVLMNLYLKSNRYPKTEYWAAQFSGQYLYLHSQFPSCLKK